MPKMPKVPKMPKMTDGVAALHLLSKRVMFGVTGNQKSEKQYNKAKIVPPSLPPGLRVDKNMVTATRDGSSHL